jgi:2,3-dihydroxybenzoate decarboxylase
MRYIALEEAFSIPGLDDRQPSPWLGLPLSQRHLADWARKLPDFTEYRLPEMDAADIDVQVLSLTVPGLQGRRRPGNRAGRCPVRQRLPGTGRRGPPGPVPGVRRAADAGPGSRSRGTPPLRPRSRLLRRAGQRPPAGPLPRRAAVRRGGRRWKNCPCRCTCTPAPRPPTGGRCSMGAPSCTAPPGAGPRRSAGTRCASSTAACLTVIPGATLILGHMGEFLPFMRSRLDSRYRTLDLKAPLQRMPSAYLGSNVMITTSGVFSPPRSPAPYLRSGRRRPVLRRLPVRVHPRGRDRPPADHAQRHRPAQDRPPERRAHPAAAA